MEASTINTLQSDHIIRALCNTLMHSLWQGILLAIVAGAIIVFTKKASAVHRYNLLTGAMALFAAGVLFTFILQLLQQQNNIATPVGNTVAVAPINIGAGAAPVSNAVTGSPANIQAGTPLVHPEVKVSITDIVMGYFNTHYNIIVLIWFLIICAKSVQMAAGLHTVYHLKRTKVFKVNKDWENRLKQLAELLNIKQAIGLMESGIAKVPMVIGHWKPVILIPIGLINSLTADEVEAILVHELAHIRRRDYLVNLLQGFMEIVFFFNPAVLWISQLIKTERENCCDDLALQQSNDKISYIQALVSCEEYRSLIPAHVMAFPGSKNSLLDRVKRMAGNRNHSLNMFEKTVLAICVVVLGLGISAFTAREHIKKALRSVGAVIHHEVKAAPDQNMVKNDTAIQKQSAPVDNASALLNQVQHPALPTIDTGKQAGLSSLIKNKIDSLSSNDGARKSPLAALAKLDTANFKKFHAIGQELYRERLVVDTNHLSISLNDRELIVNGVRMPENVFERISRQFGSKRESNNYSGRYGYNYLPSDGREPTGVIIPDFGDTLVKYGFIKDKRHIHAFFNIHGLIINGVKQPDEVCQMLLKKYGDNVNINYANNGLPDTRMELQAYWAGRQRKMIDQMQREGLITDRNIVSFTLTTKTFVVNGLVENGEVFERYRHEYVPANAGDNWNWNYNSTPGDYRAYANSYRNSAARYQTSARDRQRVEAERDKKLVADLQQDGLITDPNNVTFTLSDKKLEINGKKQSEELYNKYKDKYLPNNNRDTSWSWTYSHHE